MPTTTDLDRRITDSVREGARRIPALAARLRAADLDPESVTHEGIAQLPILTKDDLLAAQQAHPPFGGLLSDSADVVRLFQSPGPLYEPQLAGEDPWRWRPALQAAGFGADDVVMNCFGYHLSPAGAMFEAGAHALGAQVVPAGIGSQDLQARAVAACRRIDAQVADQHGAHAIWIAVSHGDVVKAVLADALGCHLDSFQRIVAGPASLSVVTYTQRRPFVVRVNDNGASVDDLRPPADPAPADGDAVPGGVTGAPESSA